MKISGFKAILLILVITLPATTNGQNLQTDPAELIQVRENYAFQVQVSGELIWQAERNSTIFIEIAVTELPFDNVSAIEISLLAFNFMGTSDPKSQGTFVDVSTLVYITNLDRFLDKVTINQTLAVPKLADEFYLDIDIFARTLGNFTEDSRNPYTVRFPQDNTILVSRQDEVIPLVNLYGFPSSDFFVKWLPIYLGILVVLLIPAVVYYGIEVKQRFTKSNIQLEGK